VLQHFSNALSLNDGNILALSNRSLTLLKLNRQAEAYEDARAILRLDPTNARARSYVTELSITFGNKLAAEG
jgi:tetratricopeptide (TPR) repeat protein